MRLVLALLALLSGFSLCNVAVASSQAELVGAASRPVHVTRQEQKACTGDVKIQLPIRQTKLARAERLPQLAHIRGCTIRIPDRPRE
jgi:hypothetical protein